MMTTVRFQAPNNVVSYRLTSDRFTMDSTTGDVYIRSSLIGTTDFLYEVKSLFWEQTVSACAHARICLCV